MEDYQSKYTGEQVEELLDIVANGEVGGGIEEETDPIFSASPAATITDAKKAEWDGKQDAIADLATIREGASKGATALQSVPSEYGTKAWVTEQARDIANDAVGDFEAVAVEPLAEDVLQLKGAIGNKVDKVTGKGLSAEDFTSALKIKLEGLNNYDDTEISAAVTSLQTQLDTLVSGDTTTAIKTFNEVIAFLDGIADTDDLANIIGSIEQQIAGKMDKVTLAKVATSGSYNDLSNKPTIPSAVTESTVSGWGFTKNTGTYSKPTGGIPKNDLSSAVQASLDKADVAVPAEILGEFVYAYANGIADDQFAYALPSSANGDEDDTIATRNTLKTINGESLFGSGDITISGGSSGGDSYTGNYPIEEITKTTFITLSPNVYTRQNSIITNSVGHELTFAEPTNTSIVNEYIYEFKCGSESAGLSLPLSCEWANDDIPTFKSGYTYVISIIHGIAAYIQAKTPSDDSGGPT